MTNGETGLWRWVELPRFARFCRAICEETGIPYEGEFDVVRSAIEDNILRRPFSVSHPDPRFNPTDEDRRVFKTDAAPGRTKVPPLVVVIRVAEYPTFGHPGVIEGREVWSLTELQRIGLSLETPGDSVV